MISRPSVATAPSTSRTPRARARGAPAYASSRRTRTFAGPRTCRRGGSAGSPRGRAHARAARAAARARARRSRERVGARAAREVDTTPYASQNAAWCGFWSGVAALSRQSAAPRARRPAPAVVASGHAAAAAAASGGGGGASAPSRARGGIGRAAQLKEALPAARRRGAPRVHCHSHCGSALAGGGCRQSRRYAQIICESPRTCWRRCGCCTTISPSPSPSGRPHTAERASRVGRARATARASAALQPWRHSSRNARGRKYPSLPRRASRWGVSGAHVAASRRQLSLHPRAERGRLVGLLARDQRRVPA